MTFRIIFCKNVARIECATHHQRLYNACIWLKKTQLAKNFLKMPKILLGPFQKQSSRGFLEKRFSREFCKIDRESPVLESVLNKVAVLHPALKKKLQQHRRFPIKFCGIFQNISGRLPGFSIFQERFLSMHFFL